MQEIEEQRLQLQQQEESLLFEQHPEFKPLNNCSGHCDLIGYQHDPDYYTLEREQYDSHEVFAHLDMSMSEDDELSE